MCMWGEVLLGIVPDGRLFIDLRASFSGLHPHIEVMIWLCALISMTTT